MKIGVNLFGLNKQLKEDFDSTILKLKEMGYASASSGVFVWGLNTQ